MKIYVILFFNCADKATGSCCPCAVADAIITRYFFSELILSDKVFGEAFIGSTADESDLSANMRKMWTNFAKSG